MSAFSAAIASSANMSRTAKSRLSKFLWNTSSISQEIEAATLSCNTTLRITKEGENDEKLAPTVGEKKIFQNVTHTDSEPVVRSPFRLLNFFLLTSALNDLFNRLPRLSFFPNSFISDSSSKRLFLPRFCHHINPLMQSSLSLLLFCLPHVLHSLVIRDLGVQRKMGQRIVPASQLIPRVLSGARKLIWRNERIVDSADVGCWRRRGPPLPARCRHWNEQRYSFCRRKQPFSCRVCILSYLCHVRNYVCPQLGMYSLWLDLGCKMASVTDLIILRTKCNEQLHAERLHIL